ncbi:MAG: phosphate ABC transporter permease PstA [Alphaproteobacteria bacterium]|jgi:phosphate transport system permease protein|nr:phosphate ABC transporter permease PstA [Alphaproteobacteria bacterium]
MTDITQDQAPPGPVRTDHHRSDEAMRRLQRRYAAERRFKWYGISAIAIALTMLVVLLTSIVASGWPAFTQSYVRLQVPIASDLILGEANYRRLMTEGLAERFPEVQDPAEIRAIGDMLMDDYATQIRDAAIRDPDLLDQRIDRWIPASPLVDRIHAGDLDPELENLLRTADLERLGLYDTLSSRRALAVPEGTSLDAASLPPEERTQVTLRLGLPDGFDPATADYQALVHQGLGSLFIPQLTDPDTLADLEQRLLAPGAATALREFVQANPEEAEPGGRLSAAVPASSALDNLHRLVADAGIERDLVTVRQQIGWLDALVDQGVLEVRNAYTHINVSVPLDADFILGSANYQAPFNRALYQMFPEVTETRERRELRGLISPGAGFDLRDRVLDDPSVIGETVEIAVATSDTLDQMRKGEYDLTSPEERRPVSDNEIAWYNQMDAEGLIASSFNWRFFGAADSRQPELAGIWGAVVGSFYTLVVTIALAFPIGVSAAIYLEEFAPKNRLTDLIEVNINNLAAVPSIVFGLLGLAVFIQFFGLPRSAPLVGGMVLALMTLPTIIIAARAALKAVPPSIREAALGMGASKLQAVTHHVLPLAMPGILTGTIIGMAQALGETAPLLMIGMVAFITSTPDSFTDPSTVLPVQIYLWADHPERGFTAKTSAAIMVLLSFLILMNGLAIWLRKKFERRW